MRTFKSIGNFIKKNNHTILLIAGATGLIATSFAMTRATIKALDILYENRDPRLDQCEPSYCLQASLEERGPKETLKLIWKEFIPVGILSASSLACIIFSIHSSNKQNAALLTAYNISEKVYNEYRTRTRELIGEEKEREILNDISKKEVETRSLPNLYSGDTMCFDTLTGRYFMSDPDVIRRIENKMNLALREDMSYSLNDIFSEYGLDSLEIGDFMGWDIDGGYVSIIFDTQLNKDDHPVLVLNYSRLPKFIA